MPTALSTAAPAGPSSIDVIVRERAPATGRAEALVRALGGTVVRELALVGGFEATLPAASFTRLAESRSVFGVWRDRELLPADDDDDPNDNDLSAYDTLPVEDEWQEAIRLDEAPAGPAATVAVLDTGVARVAGVEGAVAARVDLSGDTDGIDRYGHGTHMAGLVLGAAPEARVVSVKLANWNGAVDVSSVIAGLQWVVANRSRYGIRVVNLSYGTDSTQEYSIDPLNLAIERTWRSGILVVVAAGNRGPSPTTIEKPGDDPLVLTVGAADIAGTADTSDDAVAPFSSVGPTKDGVDKPEVLAPGISLLSARAPGSTVDELRPSARVGATGFKGTGTSQAAAVVAGVAARMFGAAPAMTPDEAKAALRGTADAALAGAPGGGSGLVDAADAIAAAQDRDYQGASQSAPLSTATGSIDASRGSHKPMADLDGDGLPEAVSGEIDALGSPWNPSTFAAQAWTTQSWLASPWAAVAVVGVGWAPAPPPARPWAGLTWHESLWSAKRWTDAAWTAKRWTSEAWSTSFWN